MFWTQFYKRPTAVTHHICFYEHALVPWPCVLGFCNFICVVFCGFKTKHTNILQGIKSILLVHLSSSSSPPSWVKTVCCRTMFCPSWLTNKMKDLRNAITSSSSARDCASASVLVDVGIYIVLNIPDAKHVWCVHKASWGPAPGHQRQRHERLVIRLQPAPGRHDTVRGSSCKAWRSWDSHKQLGSWFVTQCHLVLEDLTRWVNWGREEGEELRQKGSNKACISGSAVAVALACDILVGTRVVCVVQCCVWRPLNGFLA